MGRTIIVTGGANGIGRCITEHFASEGDTVYILDKEAKQTVRKLENRIKDLAEIIKYAEQYKDNRSYYIAYKKAKNPDAYFRRYESQIILYGGARRMLEQAGIN